jgi:hypothetical protein
MGPCARTWITQTGLKTLVRAACVQRVCCMCVWLSVPRVCCAVLWGVCVQHVSTACVCPVCAVLCCG